MPSLPPQGFSLRCRRLGLTVPPLAALLKEQAAAGAVPRPALTPKKELEPMPHPRLRQTDPNTITIDLGHQEPDGGLGDLLEILHLVCHRHEYLGDDPPNEDLAPPAHTPQELNDTTG
jgi:hypothetical protein